jgi:uncharacterized FlgJ-related protein
MRVRVMFVMIAVFTTGLVSLGKSENKKIKVVKKVIKDTTDVVAVDSSKLDRELLVSYILEKNIHHPEIAYAIVRQESNMCSNLFKTNNNLFGMRHPRVRPTKSLGSKKGFAHFEKWQHSVLDYKLYLEFVGGHKMTRAQYLLHIDRSYAHAGYSEYLEKYFKEYQELTN